MQYLEQTGDITAALNELEPLLSSSPQYYGLALEFAQKSNSPATLDRILQSAKRYYRAQLERTPGSLNTRVQLAKVLDLLGDFRATDEVLQALYAISPEEQIQEQMHELWLVRTKRLAEFPATPKNLLERWLTLSLLIQAKPNDIDIIKALYCLLRDLDVDRVRYMGLLQESSVRGEGSETLPMLRCLWAILRGNRAGFEMERQLVYQQGMDLPAILNNLAVVAAGSSPPELESAFLWSDAAVREFPSPYYYETRGQVLYRLKRYREAVSDLKRAATTPTLSPLAQPHLNASLKILESIP